jgi:hypothetical protein
MADVRLHCIHIFFSGVEQIQNIWSVVNLLHHTLHWWSAIVLLAYGVNLLRRMLDTA